MAKFQGEVIVDSQGCKGCGLCIEVCPTDTLQFSKSINSNGYHYAEVTNDACIGCANCALICPAAVITVYKIKK